MNWGPFNHNVVERVYHFSPSVFLIGHPRYGMGTGFLISKEHRLLATNAHVADVMHASDSMFAIQNDSSHAFRIDKVWYHPGVIREREGGSRTRSQNPGDGKVYGRCPDVAVVHVAGDDELPQALTLATPKEIAELFAKPMGIVGFPGHDTTSWPGLAEEAQATYRQGVIARATDFEMKAGADQKDRQFLQYTARGWFGLSGSPVFLRNGHVVALNNSGAQIERAGLTDVLTFGIRIDCLWELLAFHKFHDKVAIPVAVADLRLDRFEGAKPGPYRRTPPSAVAPFDATKAKQFQESWARHLGVPVQSTNSIGMKLVLIPPGQFMMGSPDSDVAADVDEKPQHRVSITKPFYLGVTEVTQEQGERLMGVNPSHFTGDPQRPVEEVTWEDAVEFCRRLSKQEGHEYRLPTEAEWEYACRAGSTTKWCFGDSESQLNDYAWYDDNSADTTHAVGQKKPNAWGLYDMHGNVKEWCADWYNKEYYKASPADDPKGPNSVHVYSEEYRVIRGGSWANYPGLTRLAFRSRFMPVSGSNRTGFRVCRTP